VIDSYCHCGISKYLPVEDVLTLMTHVGIERAVLAQHLGEHDNSYLAQAVDRDPERLTAVALVDADDPGWRDAVAALGESPRFSGLRVPRETLLEHSDVCRAAADAGLVLVLDASGGIAECLPTIRGLLEGGTSGIVVSHLGYPYLLDGSPAPHAERLFELAGERDVHVLLSGHSMWFEPPYSTLDDFTAEVVSTFPPQALLWGSNFPVCGDAARVAADLELLAGCRFRLDEDALALALHGNADRLWFGGAPTSGRTGAADASRVAG
jgi:predicted TIM-barrel fold metal-dependent hydrolase